MKASACCRWGWRWGAAVGLSAGMALTATASMISAIKEVTPRAPNKYHVGDTIAYELIISNPAANLQTNRLLLILDTFPDGVTRRLNAVPIIQAPGVSRTYLTNYVVRASDVLPDGKTVVNKLQVLGTDTCDDRVQALVEKRSRIIHPGIHLEKLVRTPTPANVCTGEMVVYEYRVTNTGDVPLTNIVLTDLSMTYVSGIRTNTVTNNAVIPGPLPPGGGSGDLNQDAWLDLNERWVYLSTNIMLPPIGYTPGIAINRAKVTGTDELGDEHSSVAHTNAAVCNVASCERPCLELRKSASPLTNLVNQPVLYTYVVTNCGNVTLTNVVVKDDWGTPGNLTDDIVIASNVVLAAGETATFTAWIVPQVGTVHHGTNTIPTGAYMVILHTNNDVTVTYVQDFGVNDNTYGTGAIGWGSRGHTFGNLTGSDQMTFQFEDGRGNVVLSFELDYIAAATSVTVPGTGQVIPYPSGYGTLGVLGGDGDMLVGSASNVLWFSTSLTDNLNNPGNTSKTASLIVNSPTTWNGSNVVVDMTAAPGGWNAINSYSVRVSGHAFGSNGYGLVRWECRLRSGRDPPREQYLAQPLFWGPRRRRLH